MCAGTRVLDISIARMEPVPGHIVGERACIEGTALGRMPLIVWVVPPRTDAPVYRGWLTPRLEGKFSKCRKTSRARGNELLGGNREICRLSLSLFVTQVYYQQRRSVSRE